jgi:hypothetical protein
MIESLRALAKLAVCLKFLAGLVACGTAAPPAPFQPTVELPPARAEHHGAWSSSAKPVEPTQNPEQLLADDHARRLPRRAQLTIFERARVRLDGPELVHELPREPHPDETVHVVAAQTREHVRILSEAYHLRLLVWVSRDQVRSVVTERTTVRPERRVAPGDGIVVHPGLALSAHERYLDARRVSYRDTTLRFEGWIGVRALGQIYVPVAMAQRRTDAVVDAGATVSSSGGSTFATFSLAADVVRIGLPAGGKQRILYSSFADGHGDAEAGGLELRGLVAEQQVSTGAPALANNEEHGVGWAGSHTIKIPSGTRLYDAPEGQVVAVTTEEAQAREGQRTPGWRALELMTRWGFATLHAPADMP